MQDPDGCSISDTVTSEFPVPVVLADAPVVIRIELGSITLTAQQWAQLRTGDVIATGHALGEPASLRTGGIEIAQGELVDVEGELAVRIHYLVKPKR